MSFAVFFFFFAPPSTTEIYTLSLHDALPIWSAQGIALAAAVCRRRVVLPASGQDDPSATYRDRKSTRLNSSHTVISYAVFCLKKKKQSKHKPDSPSRQERVATNASTRRHLRQ